jgi:hypothetical protein
MKPAAAETPLARRFAAALAEAEPGRTRIPIEAYTAAFLAAEPALATSPDRRARLATAIEELIEVGALKASRAVDRSELPPLPRFVVPLDRVADPPVGREAAGYAWRPELAWAARLPLRRSEFDALRAIQAFLRDHVADAPVVPTGERSLELFGDEKRLDTLRRNRRLFAPGRLSLEVLRARLYAPPFAYRRVGQGRVALVLENVATYHSALATIPPDGPVGLVVFGAGGNFSASVCYLAELAAEGPAASIREIRYFGDLDRRGLEIPIAADAAAREAGLPAVRPAVGLWARLLRVGQRGAHPAVDASTAERLTTWLPASLRAPARDVLVEGARLAQEAVGTKLLGSDPTWSTWAALGPPGVERPGDPAPELRRRSATLLRTPAAPTGEAAITLDDDGQRSVPETEAEWNSWVAAGHTRNWVLGDPVLDWLRLHGGRAGFLRDDQRPNYDPRADFRRFVLEKGLAFEAGVMRVLQERVSVVRIAESVEDARAFAKARATVDALRSEAPVVAQAVLRNPARRTYGVVDLLVRSDLLASWFPELLSAEEAALPAPGLGLTRFHYRPIDLKFHTFELTADGHVTGSADQLAYAVQVWLYAEALGRVQGCAAPAAYLLGRTWEQGEHRGEGCLERLARVDLERWIPNRETTIEQLAQDSVEWIRRLRTAGADWQVLPEPSVAELYPHARNADDAPWHSAKREIAEALRELTLLPAMNPAKRVAAHAGGIRRWSDDGVSAARLGITSPALAARADAVLAANQASAPTVVPQRIQTDPAWRAAASVEFHVDFETVSNLDDDFTVLPRLGGQALIVQIGCGQVAPDGSWHFTQWSVDALTTAEERRIIDAWVNHMAATCAAARVRLDEARVCHWSAAEPVNFESAYNAARIRHRDAPWPTSIPWFDVLERVIRAEPVAVTGSFNFGLKWIAKAMHAAGFISTTWADGPTDGLGAMVATWFAAREAAATGTSLSAHPLMIEVARYNEVDCRVMSEILGWLREHR